MKNNEKIFKTASVAITNNSDVTEYLYNVVNGMLCKRNPINEPFKVGANMWATCEFNDYGTTDEERDGEPESANYIVTLNVNEDMAIMYKVDTIDTDVSVEMVGVTIDTIDVSQYLY